MLNPPEIVELQRKYRHLINYESEDPEAPIDPLSYIDSNGDGLIHIATQLDDIRTLEILLKSDVDANQLGDMSSTALHYAKSDDAIKLLLAYGASKEIRNEFGRLPKESHNPKS